MCTSEQFSFTIPPSICSGSAFHVRIRTGMNASLVGGGWKWQMDGASDSRGWKNPLTWRHGEYFAPRFCRQTDYFVRADKAEVLPPPPVVLHRTWEAAHIVETEKTTQQPREGDLRIFSILGLTPSCDASGAKVFGYGQSRLEVEVAPASSMTWDEANRIDALWSHRLTYDIPPEPVGSVLVKSVTEAMRYRGLPAIEAAMMGQIQGSGAKKNIKTLKRFVEQIWEKLQPFYAFKIEPFLANHSLTYFLVDEMRAMVLREHARFAADMFGAKLPDEYQRDRPSISTVVVRMVPPHGATTSPRGGGTELLRWDIEHGVVSHHNGGSAQRRRRDAGGVKLQARIPSGMAFSVEGIAKRSIWNGNNQQPRRLQLWWNLKRANNFLPDELKDPAVMAGVSSGGELVSVSQLRTSSGNRVCHLVDNERGDQACVSVLHFRGVREGTLYPIHEPDSELVLGLTAIEERAHEHDSVDIRLRIVQAPQSGTNSNASASDDDATESSDEEESSTWPPLSKGTPPDVGDILARIPLQVNDIMLSIRDAAFRRLSIPEPWGSTLRDGPPLTTVQRSLEKFVFVALRTALGHSQLPPGWSDARRVAWVEQGTSLIGSVAITADGPAESSFVQAVQDTVIEVVKLRLVDTYQKTRQRATKTELSSASELAAVKKAKVELAQRVLGTDEAASQRQVDIDMEALADTDLSNVLTLVIKHIIKLEIKEAIDSELRPLVKKLVLVAVVLAVAYGLYWLHSSQQVDEVVVAPHGQGGGGALETRLSEMERHLAEKLEAVGHLLSAVERRPDSCSSGRGN